MIRALRFALAVFAVVPVFVGPVSAATDTGAMVAQAAQSSIVRGTVADGGGTPIPSANVIIEGAGTRQTTTTDASGAFTFTVPAGIYTITINKGGYQTGTTGVTAAEGTTETVNAQLTGSTLNNLQTIGRTSASVNTNTAARFDITSTPRGSVGTPVIRERNTPNLNNIVNEIPGVTINHSSANPNTNFFVRGTAVEAKTLIDGHPIANGTSGTTLSLFAGSQIFGGVDVDKGAGIGNPTSGYSGVGTVNLRTPEFTSKDSGYFQAGGDQYLGTTYTAIADLNFLDNKLQVILGKSFYGYLGPTNGVTANAVGFVPNATVTAATGQTAGTNATRVPNFGYAANYYTSALIGWTGDFSNDYNLAGYLGKIRFNFSNSTSVTGSFLGLYGQFEPQGGAYGQFVGFATIPYCLNSANTPLYSLAACRAAGPTAKYNGASAQGEAGNSNVPLYTFYPGSDVHFSQPVYDLDFKTTIGNDTLFVRPYSAVIQRFINGQNEPLTNGYGGNTYLVTSAAQCQALFVAPTATAQAKGPCVPGGASNGVPAYIGANPTSTVYFATTPNSPNCAVAPYCYVTQTAQYNTGGFGYTTPYTTFETDNLFGYTFSYIHPVGANTFNVAFDHYYDQAGALVNDASPLAAGCQFTVGGGTLPTTSVMYGGQTYGPQPTCTAFPNANGTFGSKSSPLSVPATFSSVSSLSLTAQLALRSDFEFDFGGYFTYYGINAQVEDPGLLAAFAQAGLSTATAPVKLVGANNSAAHFDPHFGFVYRPTTNIAIRGTAGSSIVIPYASQVSGLGSINLAGTGSNQTATINLPNPALRPENVVAYDLGGDFRLPRGAIVSTDLYNNVVYNAWLQPTISIPQAAGAAYGAGGTFQNKWVNTSEEIFQGVELAAGYEPLDGFGGKMAFSMERAYYLNLPQSIVQSPIAANGSPIIQPIVAFNGEQVNQIPYAKGYFEVRYAKRSGELIRFGADYEGNNNSYNAPSFWIFDSTVRVPIGFGITAQLSGSNIFNATNSAYLGAGVYNQGRVQVGSTYLPTGIANTNVSYNPVSGSASILGTNGLVNPGFRTFTFTIQKQF